MNCLKIHQNGVGGTGWARGTEGGGGGWGGGVVRSNHYERQT